jgi:gamma-glutamylcyclotransferase
MNYFAYGANLNKKVMQEHCPDSKPLFTAVLPNYKLVFVGWSRQWKGGVASIKASRGDRVRGAIYQITDRCLARLDQHEGYPSQYNRLKVIVFGEDNEPIEAITYIKAGQIEESKPSPEYLAIIQQGLRDWRLF